MFAVQTNLNGSGVVDYATLLARAADAGSDAVIELGAGNTVTLAGLHDADLSSSLFMFY